ncbi:hypothetical protein EG68_06708 [Paragonimus skrjabini miyazakii]|uniref:PITH domain-containing protein n=1 Tax=Paragonimus skrjabini miyazakii TaxID=59628 RepID=A0A8S9YNB7_9TREM|nr:hypothetical protein EG68_06708 [Paragonimus skrjabini miyazakii]
MCDHTHGQHCCHSLNIEDPAASFSLYKFINLHALECLNESVAGSGKSVFKPYESRKDTSVFVESDADEELLFNISFTGSVKLKGIIIAGDPSDQHPKDVTLYKNKPFMTFSDTDGEGDQSLCLSLDPFGDIVYPVKVARFSNVKYLGLHIRTNYGADTSRLHYIGLRGDFTPGVRQEVVITNYELTPNIADHKVDLFNPSGHLIE